MGPTALISTIFALFQVSALAAPLKITQLPPETISDSKLESWVKEELQSVDARNRNGRRILKRH